MSAVDDFLIFPIDLINYWDIWDNISNRIWSEELNRAEIIKFCLGTRVGGALIEFDFQEKWVGGEIQVEDKIWKWHFKSVIWSKQTFNHIFSLLGFVWALN